MSFKEAVQKLNTDHLPGDGFCISNKASHISCARMVGVVWAEFGIAL